jgi:hypothetical protein
MAARRRRLALARLETRAVKLRREGRSFLLGITRLPQRPRHLDLALRQVDAVRGHFGLRVGLLGELDRGFGLGQRLLRKRRQLRVCIETS